ncbi:CHASE2 domain-containing protein [Leptolyngbya sp. FACHB-711]|uniref:CHASE2 domain-containing protein n=1 Tax=Leptolyngbya sp. FACHB-711 TaxID=2692813 RepID=UPI001687BB8E|nr:CHASE2 domain-containing protein [Leptolyngbya sp. FACHB-711]MBD2028203.1 CHASE2 domain-containing protein [Leptolyngbya sp. FACHB-711]
MSKRVVLKLDGNLEQGFQVTLEIGVEGELYFVEQSGRLPPAQNLATQLEQWQQDYRKLSRFTRIVLKNASTQLGALNYGEQIEICRQAAEALTQELRFWFGSASFSAIDKCLRTILSPHESIRVLIRTHDQRLHHLPWHHWDFVEDYTHAEVAFGTPISRRNVSQPSTSEGVRILAILGDSSGIDIEHDRQILENLPGAMVEFLVEPSLSEISQQLWEQRWNVLFFAGHSRTEANQGRIFINPQESLSIEDLKLGLRQSIAHGLKLAIFNSCDGLGLAYELEPLHLPQLIVMRQPIPDRVAQAFLKYLLRDYAGGQPFYLSVRRARERLQEAWEREFPCAGWLPVIFQNPVEIPPTWTNLLGQNDRSAASSVSPAAFSIPSSTTAISSTSSLLFSVAPPSANPFAARSLSLFQWLHFLPAKRAFRAVLIISIITTLMLTGVQASGVLQLLELKALDQMMVRRPPERPDPRILIVEVTEADIQAQKQRNEPMQRVSTSAQTYNQTFDVSLSDHSLKRILDVLLPYQPHVIGLDIYRDFAVLPDQPELAAYLRQQPIIAACKAGDFWDAEIPTIDPPPEVPADRTAFSDFQKDDDQVLRRQLLQMIPLKQRSTMPCRAVQSFSASIAFAYLRQQGITAQITPYDDLQLGSRTFQSLRSRQGGYQFLKAADKGVSQILLNYRATPEPAIHISMGELLDPQTQINPAYIKDKIVLIGVTAPGDDFWDTPYSLESEKQIPGVKIHAHMVSQLISAALDQRPLLWAWSPRAVFIWTFVWSFLSSILTWQLSKCKNIKRLLIYLVFTTVFASISLWVLCFCILLTGDWLPFVPALLAFIISSSITAIFSTFKSR